MTPVQSYALRTVGAPRVICTALIVCGLSTHHVRLVTTSFTTPHAGAQNLRPATNGEQAHDTLSPVSVDGNEPGSPSKAAAIRALDVPPPPPPQPG